MSLILGEYLREAKQALAELSDSASIDAELLMSHTIKKDRVFMFAHPEFQLSEHDAELFSKLVARREKGEPIAHIIQEKEFWSLPLKVNSHTLIPRPDTEVLVEKVLEFLPKQAVHVLDLGTGTGAIALAIAKERPDCTITAVDVIPEAVSLAKENANNLGIKNVVIGQSSWFSSVQGMYSCIVSNPPYIDDADAHLNEGDVRFEPRSALVAGNHGFADIELIADQAKQYLLPGGGLFLEHGWKQGERVRQILANAGFRDVATCQDYGGNDRVTFGIL